MQGEVGGEAGVCDEFWPGKGVRLLFWLQGRSHVRVSFMAGDAVILFTF